MNGSTQCRPAGSCTARTAITRLGSTERPNSGGSCASEVLVEKVIGGHLREDQALWIGRQIPPDNALELFPQLKERLWKKTRNRLVPKR